MSTKLITLITGANQGVGYYAAQHLASSGTHHVLLGSRDLAKGQKAVQTLIEDGQAKVNKGDIEALQIDVTSDESIAQAEKSVREKFGRLDILINNAGISSDPSSRTPREEYQSLYNTNVFGPSLLTTALTPLLKNSTSPNGKRIIFVSSSLASLTYATAPGSQFPGNVYNLYRSTKTALGMIMAGVHADLAPSGFVVTAVCPGYCGTNLNGFQGYKDPAEGAKVVVDAVEGKKEDLELRVIHRDGKGGAKGVHPW